MYVLVSGIFNIYVLWIWCTLRTEKDSSSLIFRYVDLVLLREEIILSFQTERLEYKTYNGINFTMTYTITSHSTLHYFVKYSIIKITC